MDQIADYRFIRSLGRGNNGEFQLAETPARLGIAAPQVVVKVLDGHTPEDSFRRATRELRAFASVASPYLVELYDAGQEGDRFYYSMEYLPIGSLAMPTRPLTRAEVLHAVADAARAAHALHEHGISHRDIQPTRVLVTETGGKLADLGLAQVLEPGLTVTGFGNIGSVEYVDPAVLQGGPASRSADIWALGVTLHRALTGIGVYGELPEREPLVAIRRVLSGTPVLSDTLSGPERSVIERCTATDPADRYHTAAELAEALDSI